MDAEAEEGLTVADYVSGEEKCGTPAPNGASVCARDKGHDGGHRNAWSTAEWPAQPCTYIYGPNGNQCAFANGDEQHDHRTATGLGYVHQDQWRPVQSAEHTPQTGGPGMQPYDESVAKQLARLQRKVRAQANQINKLEELRRAAVNKQPEHRELADQLRLQVQLTMRENALRRQAETDRDSERERGDRFQEELRKVMNDLRTDHVDQVRHNNDRFYRLAALLTDDTAGETWDTLLQRVADLRTELEVERARANARKAERDKLNARLTGHDAVRMFMGPSAERDKQGAARMLDTWRERAEAAELTLIGMECGEHLGPDDLPCLRVKGHRGTHLDAMGGSW